MRINIVLTDDLVQEAFKSSGDGLVKSPKIAIFQFLHLIISIGYGVKI